MSIQWTAIAGYLYLEIAIVIIMMLPIASPRKWRQFFKSRLFDMFQQNVATYFYVFIGVLCLFLIDAIREIRKYSHGPEPTTVHLANEMKDNIKLFRAQRNFYITGFAIFLTFVIRRLVTMLIIQAELLEKAEKIIKDAESAKELAKATVLAHTIQAAESKNCDEVKKQLEQTEKLLDEERHLVLELQEEITKWQAKYEGAINNYNGKGDK